MLEFRAEEEEMSRPKHYWYGSIRKMIMSSDLIKNERTLQATIFARAFEDAIEETRKLPNGELRLKAVDEILIKKTKTYEGVALEVSYERKTIQNWVTSFVNLVGKKAGY